MADYVAYYRVSTKRQGKSGLGLEAQQKAVADLIEFNDNKLIAEYREEESGKRNDRPELTKALNRCQATGATLIVAKLDRLSRNAAFLMTLRDSGVKFVAADMPDANTLTVGILAVVAQAEREAISQRTKDALAAAKARGVKLGGRRRTAADIRHYQQRGVRAAQKKADERVAVIADELIPLRDQGLSLNAIAKALNDRRIQTSRGCEWTPTAVKRALARLP
jgi:DNA invertase Pin-like site-specific DNA recombinase